MRAEAEIGLRSSEAETGTRAGTDTKSRGAIGLGLIGSPARVRVLGFFDLGISLGI